jgi:hypothetical protein
MSEYVCIRQHTSAYETQRVAHVVCGCAASVSVCTSKASKLSEMERRVAHIISGCAASAFLAKKKIQKIFKPVKQYSK